MLLNILDGHWGFLVSEQTKEFSSGLWVVRYPARLLSLVARRDGLAPGVGPRIAFNTR